MSDGLVSADRDRRWFLQSGGAVIAAGALGSAPQVSTSGARYPKELGDPFTLGVASGDPGPRSVVLWTRLAPDPLNGGGMPRKPVRVRWTIADDDRLRHVVRTGVVWARPGAAHTIHVDVHGLRPDRWYHYAFEVDGYRSPIGRTRTLPAFRAAVSRLDFAFVSCQEYQFGWYSALRRLSEEQVDFVVHLGDYLYETGNINPLLSPVRQHEDVEVVTLDEYRHRYAVYKLDPDLQAAHQSFPFIHTWDDHEVDNDWAGTTPSDPDLQTTEQFLDRRAVAAKAFYEHLPLSRRSRPRNGSPRLHRVVRIGDLATIHLLDTRQFRSDQPCGTAPRANPPVLDDCEARFDPELTMLGDRQERWLVRGLRRSEAQWNVIASSCWFSPFTYTGPEGQPQLNTDQWDGYPVARQRIVEALADGHGPSNPVVISGDWHVNAVSDVKLDWNDPASPTVAAEFSGTSISSVGPWAPIMAANLAANPHVQYVDGDDLRNRRDVHGYVRCSLTPDQWTTDFRVLTTVKTPDQPVTTAATFVVENGRPGAQPA